MDFRSALRWSFTNSNISVKAAEAVSWVISVSAILSERMISNTLTPKASANGSIVFISGKPKPVAYHDIAGLEYVTKHSDVPIMSDESCFNSKDALRLVERRAIDYLNIKLMKCGGIREALKINAICEAAGIEVMLGCMVEESNLGITAAASLGAATRNITRADLDATFNMTERPFKGGIYVEDTKKLVLPDVPGFGFIGFDNE